MTTGYEELRTGSAWVDLSSRGAIRVAGEDRSRLLHAMSTNHVNELEPGHGLYAFFLNDKGRILADAYIYNLGDSLWLDTEPEIGAKLFTHLDRYIIADDAELQDETSKFFIAGLEGRKSFEAATALGLPVPEAANSVAHLSEGFVARVSSTGAVGVRLFIPLAGKPALLERFKKAGITQASESEARTVRLENGTPRYGDDITERYLVQETQVQQAVHFNKGCYLGQEIVERIRSRGQVHRLLTPVRIEIAVAPAAGTKLSADGKEAGEITSVAYSPALQQSVGLAYLRSEAVNNKTPMILAGTEPPVPAYIR